MVRRMKEGRGRCEMGERNVCYALMEGVKKRKSKMEREERERKAHREFLKGICGEWVQVGKQRDLFITGKG